MRKLTPLTVTLVLAGSLSAQAETLRLIIDAASAGLGQGGNAVVNIKLGSASGAAFGKFTADRIGEQIELKIGGKTVTTPTVRDAIFGGNLQISGDYTIKQATELAADINDGSVVVEVTGSDK